MAELPSVYIILVNYNGAKDTLECLDSLRGIDYDNYKVIVVENGSSDDSLTILSAYQDENVIIISQDKNRGFSGGNNVGIKYALDHQADYILLLNNDTLVKKDFLLKLVESAIEYGGKALITGKIMYAYKPEIVWYAGGEFNTKTSRTTHTGIDERDKADETNMRKVTFVSGCCMLIPQEIVKNVGLMSEAYFLYCEDLDYCCRIRAAGYDLIYNPWAVIYHKVNASTGKISDTVSYYSVRNRRYIIDCYIEPKYQIFAKLYTFVQDMKRVLTKEYSYKAYRDGIRDYKQGILNKKQD